MNNWKAWVVVIIVIAAGVGALFLIPERDTPSPGVDPEAGRDRLRPSGE